MEKLLLGAFLSFKELNVINQEDIDFPVKAAEGIEGIFPNGPEKVIGELLAG